MNLNELNANTSAEALGYGPGAPYTNDADGCANDHRPPSLREQAEKSVGYHRSQADKADRAAAFFRENPAFDKFVQLIRSGAIQI